MCKLKGEKQAGVKGKKAFRVFTHEGRVSELDQLENAGERECRYIDNPDEAVALYASLFNNHLTLQFKRVSVLASSKIGSDKVLSLSLSLYLVYPNISHRRESKVVDYVGVVCPH